MTHPYYHATSSAAVFGGDADDYLAIHRLLDSSKAHFCDYRHRTMLHHREGVEWIVEQLGESVVAGGQLRSTRLVAQQHILEDCGGTLPTAQDWIECIPVQNWMRSSITSAQHAAQCARRFGGKATDYLAIHEWLDARNHPTDCRWQLFRHHAEGSFDAEAHFGVTLTNSRGRKIPTRYVVEEHLKGDFGKVIPCLADWLKPMQRKWWMARVHKVL